MTVITGKTGTQRLIGYVLDVSDPAGAACILDLDDRHLNRQDILHGGIAATLLDNAMGATGSLTVDPSGTHPFMTLSLTVNYLAPGRPGRITARGRVTGGGRATLFIEGALRHEDGTLIATATGVFRKTKAPS
ncbi:PaaI family thioesterase [Paracoccus aestuarii]|uniref:PaaI family thioesterase n=1 Tax=Paracoccus aestuarii TaxID=453842 RepID=A0A418ZUI3_9RHOB|nr:PaaI family thioesterase [Paracoccus aestuarii]RJL02897.1 PaaI family thioesterase [Paracoccus aestuarii]WCQ98950.1 PaaI family thioesterase [Paracoccus aestuarii]